MLIGLQYLRAIAAIVVIFSHVINQLVSNLELEFTTPMDLGARGVSLFFVLSGYIIYRAHYRDDMGQVSALRFVIKRIKRIIPFTFIVATFWAGIVIAAGYIGRPEEIDLLTWLSSAFVLPFAKPEPGVIWTLRHELLFYAIFLLFYWSPRFLAATLVVWTIASALVVTGHPFEAADTWDILFATVFSSLNVLFLLGILVAMLDERMGKIAHPNLAFGLALVLLVAAALWTGPAKYTLEAVLIFGGASAVAVLTGARTTVSIPWLAFLGDASYAIYLFHTTMLPIAFIGLSPFLAPYPVVFFVVESLCLLFLSIGFYVSVERPIVRLLRRRTPRHA